MLAHVQPSVALLNELDLNKEEKSALIKDIFTTQQKVALMEQTHTLPQRCFPDEYASEKCLHGQQIWTKFVPRKTSPSLLVRDKVRRRFTGAFSQEDVPNAAKSITTVMLPQKSTSTPPSASPLFSPQPIMQCKHSLHVLSMLLDCASKQSYASFFNFGTDEHAILWNTISHEMRIILTIIFSLSTSNQIKKVCFFFFSFFYVYVRVYV